MYYGVIMVSVVMFGAAFACNRNYQRSMGAEMFAAFLFSAVSALAGCVVLSVVNGLQWEFTPFTLAMAVAVALNGIAYTFCGLKTLGLVDLSRYSLFAMLGGMVLPSVVGVLAYGEGLTVAKVACYACVIAALVLTLKKSETKGGYLYYAGVFVLNGMSGVLSKLFSEAPFEKTSASGYSLLCALCTLVIAGTLAAVLFPSYKRAVNVRPILWGSLHGAINYVANFLLVIALAHVPASVQYPMVTGGVIIVSTVIAWFTSDKPSIKEQWSVVLAFMGVVLLVTIPV